MSTDTLHAIANNDTPQTVNVPRDINGLIVWAIGRFGGGILIAAACAFALSKVYEDHAKQTERLLTLLELRAKADSELSSAITALRGAIEDVGKEARSAHTADRNKPTHNNTP